PEPGADSGTVTGGDDWLFGADQAIALDIQRRDTGRRLVGAAALRVKRRAVAEIGTGTECFTLRRQYDRANVSVFVEAFESAGDVLDQRDVEEVIRRSPDLDQGDVTSFFDSDVTHGICPLYSAAVLRFACCAVRLTIKAS